jgi:hypothetical protein
MYTKQGLSYDEDGRLWLDEWEVSQDEAEEAALPESLNSVRSRVLGLIDNPQTSFRVPDDLHNEHETLLQEWAIAVATRKKPD